MRLEALPATVDWDATLRALRTTFLKWDGDVEGRSRMPPWALVLSRREHEGAVAAAEALAAACLRHQRDWVANGPPDDLRLPDGLDRLALAGPAGPYVTRVDLFQTEDGWCASECNDDVPGGYNEAIGLPALLEEALPEAWHVPGDLPQALARLVGATPGARIGLTFATGYAEDRQVAELLARLWEAEGAEVTLASPARLEAGVRLDGQRVDRAFRFFPTEWHAELPNHAAWQEAAAAQAVTNPFACAWTQHKGAFAHVAGAYGEPGRSGDGPGTLVPRTLPARTGAAMAIADQRAWVVKPAFGRMGAGVVCGDAVSAKEWGKRMTEATRSATTPFVVQERFRPVRLAPPGPAPSPAPAGGLAAAGAGRTACIGAYVIDGRFAGYYTRLAPGAVVAHHAENVLTVVEGA